MEVVDDVVQVMLCVLLKLFRVWCCDDKCGVVCVNVHVCVLCGFANVIDVKNEQCCGESAALWYAVCYGLWW